MLALAAGRYRWTNMYPCRCVDLSILRLSVWDTEVDTENTKVLPSPRTEG